MGENDLFYSVDAELQKEQEFSENMTSEFELEIEREIDAAFDSLPQDAKDKTSHRSFAFGYWAAVKKHHEAFTTTNTDNV